MTLKSILIITNRGELHAAEVVQDFRIGKSLFPESRIQEQELSLSYHKRIGENEEGIQRRETEEKTRIAEEGKIN